MPQPISGLPQVTLYSLLLHAETYALLAFIALSAAQSSAQTYIHSQVHWLVGTPYLAIKASDFLEV